MLVITDPFAPVTTEVAAPSVATALWAAPEAPEAAPEAALEAPEAAPEAALDTDAAAEEAADEAADETDALAPAPGGEVVPAVTAGYVVAAAIWC